MAAAKSCAVLVVSADLGRRERAERTLTSICEVIHAEDTSAAIDELSLGRPLVVLVDSTLPEPEVTAMLESVVDPARIVLWGSEFRAAFLDYGAFVQIPDQVDESVMAAAVLRLAEVQNARAALKTHRARAERLDRVMAVIEEVRQEMNSPLTAIMAEIELLLTEEGELVDSQRHSLETIEAMTRRVRELAGRLNTLGSDE